MRQAIKENIYSYGSKSGLALPGGKKYCRQGGQ
jgi:hypothetical protein